MSPISKFLFVFSSLAPLYLLMAVALYTQEIEGWWISLLLLAISILAFLYLLSGMKRHARHNFNVSVGDSLDENIIPYLISFIPPAISSDYTRSGTISIQLIYYVSVFLLLFFSRSIYINVFFLMFGLRVYSARLTDTDRQIVLIVKRRTRPASGIMSLHEIVTSETYYLSE